MRFALGFHDQVFLGLTHLILDGWAIYLSVLAMRRGPGAPVTLGIGLNSVGMVVALSVRAYPSQASSPSMTPVKPLN